jgi:two-component system, cell cycle response regulator DivK
LIPSASRNCGTAASLSVSVLIVDDSADTREMYECALASAGFRVLHADNGADGLSRAAEALPDVIVTDLSIPRIDGFELLARIQTDPGTQRIPVIVLSGRTDADASQRAIEAGAAAFLLKPCSPESLVDEVRRALSASGA